MIKNRNAPAATFNLNELVTLSSNGRVTLGAFRWTERWAFQRPNHLGTTIKLAEGHVMLASARSAIKVMIGRAT